MSAPDPSAITSFWGEHRFLSNFAPAEVEFDGDRYPTVEHAYQAAKTADPAIRRAIGQCDRPGQAKKLSARLLPNASWAAERRLEVMTGLLRQKFAAPQHRDRLLAAAGRLLVEGNSWGDRFWGVTDGEGCNHLGNILMRIRSESLGLRPAHLGIDLEGTLISNAVSQFHRDGVGEFLHWATTRFTGMTLVTAVTEHAARRCTELLADEGNAPADFGVIDIVSVGKRLKRRDDLPHGAQVLMVDDQPALIAPDLKDRLIAIEPWEAPYPPDDGKAFTIVRSRLDDALITNERAWLNRTKRDGEEDPQQPGLSTRD